MARKKSTKSITATNPSKTKISDEALAKKEWSVNLKDTLRDIQKRCGQGSIMRLGAKETQRCDAISTGSLNLDLATGIGGLPRGRITEIYGPESSGKTTLALTVVANAQKSGGIAAFIDAEHALDPGYARRLGVNTDDLLISQPDFGEQALSIVEMLLQSGELDAIVIDSVAALVPKSELDGEMGDSFVGLQARLLSQAMRKLTGIIGRTRCSVIFINQIREKIGVMFGSPETTTGGRALKFYSSIRIDIRRAERIKTGDLVRGNRTKVKIVKNKLAPPFRRAEFDIIFNEGISWEADILDQCLEHGVIKRSGSWFSFGESRLGQGREKVLARLKEDKSLLAELEGIIIPKVFPEDEEEEGTQEKD